MAAVASRILTPPPPSSTQPLQIKSVVAPDHVKGYIYVESYKQTHVKSAIEGIGNLRMGLWNQQMVPIKEMTDVLKVVKEVTNLKPKSWVRLKRGLYKDDIAQVPASRRPNWQSSFVLFLIVNEGSLVLKGKTLFD